MRLISILFALLFSWLIAGCSEQHVASVEKDASKPVAASVPNSRHSQSTGVVPAAQGIYGSAIVKVPVKDLALLGKLIFFDPSLSASGKQSCASCHDPRHAYAPANRLSVQLGGKDLKILGTRAAPSLRYVQNVPPFSERFFDNDGDDSQDQGPTGGHDWDGRASSHHEQAAGPLLSATEMGNGSAAEVVKRLQNAEYADQFRKTFGNDIFARPAEAFLAATMALEVFQETPAEFYPYTSKYDAFLRGQAQLSKQEARGLALFNRRDKGNCAACHISEVKSGAFPAFTDFGYIAIGVPRNARLPANAVANFFDMGLCGPQRTDLTQRAEYCGLFRTPSLRNVATRQAFFHNGVLHSLEEVLAFYATRDTNPARWYPRNPDGTVRKFDDLPVQYLANVTHEPPFGRQLGQKPALNKQEIADIIAFLQTLTDGYVRPGTRLASHGR